MPVLISIFLNTNENLKMNIRLTTSYELNSVDGRLCIDFLDKFLKFQPSRITVKYKSKEFVEAKYRKLIANYSTNESVYLDDARGNIFTVGPTFTNHPHTSVSIEQSEKFMEAKAYDLSDLIIRQGFVSAYLYNAEYVYVHSQIHENNFKNLNIPNGILESIKNTPYKLGVLDAKEFDIRFNPGRQVLIDYTWLVPAWKMWFGEPFYKLVPKEKILSFPYAVEIKELENKCIYVQLFEKVEESYSPDSIFRQWKWREWLDFDELEKNYS